MALLELSPSQRTTEAGRKTIESFPGLEEILDACSRAASTALATPETEPSEILDEPKETVS